MKEIIFIVITVIFITAAFFVWYFIHRSKEKERLMLIEKGRDPSELPEMKVFNFRFPWLKIGVVIVSIAIGILTGLFIEYLIHSNGGGDGLVGVFIILFGGIGMIIAHYVDKS